MTDDLTNKTAELLATAISIGLKDIGEAFRGVYCEVGKKGSREDTILSFLATVARLTTLEIVLAKSVGETLKIPLADVSRAIAEVRGGTVGANILANFISKNDAKCLAVLVSNSESLLASIENHSQKDKLSSGLVSAVKALNNLKSSKKGKKQQ